MQPANDLPEAKGHHEYVPAPTVADSSKPTGYVAKEYEHQEYPKVVGSRDGKDVIAHDADEEKAWVDSQKPAEPAQAPQE